MKTKAVLNHEDDLFTMDKPITQMKVVFTPTDNRFPNGWLTIGKTYEVIQTLSERYPSVKNYYQIQNDKGDQHSYFTENFTELSEYRKNQIDKIID